MNDVLISKQELLNKLDELDQQELYLPCHFKEYVVDEVASVPQKTGWWKTSNGETIREWTVDEYIRWNPEDKKILPYKIDGKTINVEAHCVEIRRIYATHKGRKTMCFFDWIEYC